MSRVKPAILIDRYLNAAVWRKGRPLDDASWWFSPLELHHRHQEAKSLAEQFSENAGKLSPDAFQAKPRDMSAVALEFINVTFKPSEIRNEMRTWLQTALGSGKYAAYGDWAPINPDNPSRLIPADYFQHGKVHWTKSLLKMGNTEIIAIKIFRPSWVKSDNIVVAKNNSGQAQSKTIGRPTRKGEIETVIQALAAKNGNILELPPKQRSEEIRRRVIAISPPHEGKPDDWGLSDQVIDRVIAKYFEDHPPEL